MKHTVNTLQTCNIISIVVTGVNDTQMEDLIQYKNSLKHKVGRF